MIQVAEIIGLNGYHAYQAFNHLLLGLKMLPMYLNEPHEEFFSRMDGLPEEKQRELLKQAAMHVKLEPDELESLMSFCKDKNGVTYNANNIKSIKPEEFIEIIVAVCMAIAKASKVDLISDSEKKK